MQRRARVLLAGATGIIMIVVGSFLVRFVPFSAQVTPSQFTLDPGAPGAVGMTWQDAQAECEAAGMSLAVIESEEENAAALAALGGTRNVWIGLHIEGSGFSWVDGTPLSYTKWTGGQPNTKSNWANASQQCVFFAHTSDNGWHDFECSGNNTLMHYLCENSQKCGDGTKDTDIDPAEECDDGNTTDGDGCSADCKNECGNGTVDTGEECDPEDSAFSPGCGPGFVGDYSCGSDCKITDTCEDSCNNIDPDDGDPCTIDSCLDGEVFHEPSDSEECQEQEPDGNPPEDTDDDQWWENLSIQVATACVRPSGENGGAGGGGAGGAGGAGGTGGGQNGLPTAQVATDVHNVNEGGAIAFGPLQRFLAQAGGNDWPAMEMKIELQNEPDGRLVMGLLKNAKVYKNGANPDDPGVRETIPPIVSADQKTFTWTTKGTIPVGYDFATWIQIDAYDTGGQAVVTYRPAKEAEQEKKKSSSSSGNQANLGGVFLAQVGASSSKKSDVLHQRRVIDLRSPKCEDFSVDKTDACPGDMLVYIGAFADPSATTVRPSVPLHNCLDQTKIMAMEPESCGLNGTTIRCAPLSFSEDRLALLSFAVPVKENCPAGTKITMYANGTYAPSQQTTKTATATTTVKNCGQTTSSSRSSSSRSSSSSSRSSSRSSSSVRVSSSVGGDSSVRTSSSVSRTSSRSSLIVVFSSPRSSSSRTSALSSRISSQSTSLSIFSSQGSLPGTCSPDACGAGGGNAYCAAQGKQCTALAGPPCIVCVNDGDVSSVPSTISSAMSFSSSRILWMCGNNVIDAGEECDDGNRRDFDGCSQDCLAEGGRCGDGILQRLLGEQCEPSLTAADDTLQCDTDCRFLLQFCGDGIPDLGEQCDDGDRNSDAPNARCRTYCALARCGDGVTDTVQNEECDDGNIAGGDGCSSGCQRELAAPSELAGQLFEFPVPGQAQTPVLPGTIITDLPVHSPVGSTGPASIAAMAAGAAAGIGWMRKKRRK